MLSAIVHVFCILLSVLVHFFGVYTTLCSIFCVWIYYMFVLPFVYVLYGNNYVFDL